MPVSKYKTKEEEMQARVDTLAVPKYRSKEEDEARTAARDAAFGRSEDKKRVATPKYSTKLEEAQARAEAKSHGDGAPEAKGERPKSVGFLASLDADGDGKVSAGEMLAGGSRVLRSAGSAVSSVGSIGSMMGSSLGMDLDGDGQVTAAEMAEGARRQKEKAKQAYQDTKNELGEWERLRKSGDYDALLDAVGSRMYSVKDAMSRRLEKLAKDDDSYGSEETVDDPLFEPLTRPFAYPKDRPKPLPDPDFALHMGYREAIDHANRLRDTTLRKQARTITKNKGHDGVLRIGSRRERSEAISRHELGRPQTPGAPSRLLRGRSPYPKGEGAPSPTVAERLKRGATHLFDDVRHLSLHSRGATHLFDDARHLSAGRALHSVEASAGRALHSVEVSLISSMHSVGSLSADDVSLDSLATAASDLADATKHSAQQLLGGFRSVMTAGAAREPAPAPFAEEVVRPTSAGEFFPRRSGCYVRTAPPGSTRLDRKRGALQGLHARGLRRRLANAVRMLAASVGQDYRPHNDDEDEYQKALKVRDRTTIRRILAARQKRATTKSGWLWYLERHGAWKRRFYELRGTTLIAFDGPSQWRPKEVRVLRRQVECGWAVQHAKLVDEIARKDCGQAFFAPERARSQAKEPEGLASSFLSGVESEAPLSLTVYGREDHRDVAVLFRAERDEGAWSWTAAIRQAVLRADLQSKGHKEKAASVLLQDLATAQALTAHRRDAVLGELERKNLVDRRGVGRVKEGFVELAYLPPSTAVDAATRQRAEAASPHWLRAFVTLGEDAALHIGTDAHEARSHEPLIILSLRNCAFEIDFESRRGHVELRLKTRLREVRFRPRHKVALEAWLTAIRDVLVSATRANDVPGASLEDFRARDGPLMGKGAVEADMALALLTDAADDVLDVSLEDVLLASECCAAFKVFVGENAVVIDTWRHAGALLDACRKHRIDIENAGGKDLPAAPHAVETVEDLRTTLELVWSHKMNAWTRGGALPLAPVTPFDHDPRPFTKEATNDEANWFLDNLDRVLTNALRKATWEALCPVDRYGDDRDVEEVLVEPAFDSLFASLRAQCHAYLLPHLEAFRDTPKFEFVARKLLHLTPVEDPTVVDDALLSLQAAGDALPIAIEAGEESSYESSSYTSGSSYSDEEESESESGEEAPLAIIPPKPSEDFGDKALPLGRRLVLYTPVPWHLTKPANGAPVERTSKKDHQTPKRGNVVKDEVWVALNDGINEVGRHAGCAVVLHTDARCSRVHGRLEVEPHPHARENCSSCPFDRASMDKCRKFCDECRCFVCRKPPRLCADWSAHCLAVSTSVQSQQRRKLWERRRAGRGEPRFVETLAARCFYVDLGSSRGTVINGKLARGRVPLRPGDTVRVGHTSITFAIQQAGAAHPLRAEPVESDSSDDDQPKKRPSLLKDMMRSTLSGITAKKELGVDSDQQDMNLEKAKKDTTALEGVGSKEERIKRLNNMRSRTQSAGERKDATAHMGAMGGATADASVKHVAKKHANTPMDELKGLRHSTAADDESVNSFDNQSAEHSGLGFLKKDSTKKKSFKWEDKK